MSVRVSLYNEIHKGLRSQLLGLVIDTSKADPHSADTQGSLVDRYASLRSMLEEHASHEDRCVEPLVEKLRADLAAGLSAEHERIHALMLELEQCFARWVDATQSSEAELVAYQHVHAKLNAFAGAYLTHMSREEDEIMPVLQAAMTDEELMVVTGQLRGAIAPERMGEYLAVMIPAMNVIERTGMFTGLKANAPEPVFAGTCELAAGVLEAADWAEVRARVGI